MVFFNQKCTDNNNNWQSALFVSIFQSIDLTLIWIGRSIALRGGFNKICLRKLTSHLFASSSLCGKKRMTNPNMVTIDQILNIFLPPLKEDR